MYELSVVRSFSAAHHLRGYAGACGGAHGHNWEVEVRVSGADLDGIGMVVDFRTLGEATDRVLDELDHCDLNTLAAFTDKNPTSENIAAHLFGALSLELDRDACRVTEVRVSESPGKSVIYREGA